VKRPTAHRPHLPGLYKLDRLADESVALAEQIKAQVKLLRGQDTDDTGEIDDDHQ
jgi:hypothetical protein